MLTRLNGAPFALNPDLIERAESTPDTVIVEGYGFASPSTGIAIGAAFTRFTFPVITRDTRVAVTPSFGEAVALEERDRRYLVVYTPLEADNALYEAVRVFNRRHSLDWAIRVGMNSGPVVAGIIGTKKFSYDLWGDTVNIASRMESHGQAGEIQVTESTKRKLEHLFQFTPRGLIQIKGKGPLPTYLLNNPDGLQP